MKYSKLMRNHSNLFSTQKTGNYNPSSSSTALKVTKYTPYMFSSSFAPRNCAECDSHIGATGYKSICPFFIVYGMTVSYHCHANLLRAFLLHTYFVLHFTFAYCGFVIFIYIYICIYIQIWIFEQDKALSDSMKRRDVC
jgi:hypothetical protein